MKVDEITIAQLRKFFKANPRIQERWENDKQLDPLHYGILCSQLQLTPEPSKVMVLRKLRELWPKKEEAVVEISNEATTAAKVDDTTTV